MPKDRDLNFLEHSAFLSEIAQNILDGNTHILSIPGVREIIALYLLIPYATQDQLDAGMHFKMPRLNPSEEFAPGLRLQDLRDAICHSFVTVEESSKDRPGRIIVDDRAQMKRSAHDKQSTKSKCVNLDISYVHSKLKELHATVIGFVKSDT